MKIIGLLLLSTLLTVQLSAQILVPTAEFKFDGSLTESISNLSPDSSAAIFSYGDDQIGILGAALDIVAGKFTLPDPSFTQFGLGDFSISVWIKRTASLWPAEYLITKNGSDGYLRLRYNGFFDQMVFYFRPTMDSTELTVGTPSQSVDTVWNLYTITLDRDSTMQLFQNDNLISEKDISSLVAYSANFSGGDLSFGVHDIVMNDLVFFDKALTLEEVTTIFNNELSLDDLSQHEVILYPNPVSTTLKIKSDKAINEEYQIVSISGKIVQKGLIENGEIDVSRLNSGHYSLHILDRYFSLVIK